MHVGRQLPKMIRTSLFALLAVFFSGCTILYPWPQTEPDIRVPDPAPEPVQATPAPKPPPKSTQAPAKPVIDTPQAVIPRVAIVVSDGKPAFASVARELSAALQDYSVFNLAESDRPTPLVFARIAESDPAVVVAIGLRAAKEAKRYAKVPIVYCQVFNIGANNLISDQSKGIASIPPLELQLRAWKQLDPGLETIGAIIGEGHGELIAEATRATEAQGIELRYRISQSDRESLYTFNRLIPDIDGFWLFPDNRVLSPTVLRHMLDYASRHRVQVAVFSPVLLDMGATISATSVHADIAARTLSVINRLAHGGRDSIPAITPLKEIDIRTNPTMVEKYGLSTIGTRSAAAVKDAR